MIIKASKHLDNSAVSVILLKTGVSPANHVFVQALQKIDRKYFELARRAFDPDVQAERLIVLPSGKTILFVSAGNVKRFNNRRAILAMRHIISSAKGERVKTIEIYLHDFETPRATGIGLAELFATQAEIANFEFNRYKQPPKQGWTFVETTFVHSRLPTEALQVALDRGKIIGEEINKARSLSNTPGSDMTPALLAEAAQKAGRSAKFGVHVMHEDEIRKLGMGGVLGVARGSDEPPKFIVIEYLRGRRGEKPVVLVGKGVTFDTGGLNLKPSDHIYEMHMDMSGGAAVIHIITALARLGVKKNIVGLIPAVENMPSGSSYHPGDLLKTMSGKTIEVLNTDAEGRVILADALTYGITRYKPKLLIDVATLTGAAMSALGQRASAIFTTDPKLEKTLRDNGEETGDFVWPLPLWEEYEEDVKGTFGDVANANKTRYGGAINGAVFLWQFIKAGNGDKAKLNSAPPAWAHLDIAPRMTTIDGEWLSKGAAGASIALLVKFLRG